jgi:hypothetical protein
MWRHNLADIFTHLHIKQIENEISREQTKPTNHKNKKLKNKLHYSFKTINFFIFESAGYDI